MFVVHPRDPTFRPVDRDFVFIMSTYDIDPGTYLPKVNEMTDFNMWTWNSRVFPGIDPLAVRLGDRVRVRIGNLTMTNHPIHLHGHNFAVSCTDGGWVPESAQWPETTTDVPVGAIRAFDFLADNPGDWAFHCHKSHHTMNAMGHDVKNLIGVSKKDLAKAVGKLAPGRDGDGIDGHGDGRDGNADARQHAADDDGIGTVRADRNGRHVHGHEDPRGPRARRATPIRVHTRIRPGTVAYEIDAPNRTSAAGQTEGEATKPAEMKGMKGMKGNVATLSRPTRTKPNPTKGKKNEVPANSQQQPSHFPSLLR